MLGRRSVGAVAAVLLLTAGCTPSTPDKPSGQAPALSSEASSYVALGDSYVSGAGIEPQDPSSRDCLRSMRNWPTLLADALAIDGVVDVSCAGASTRHLVSDIPTDSGLVPAQLSTLRRSTDLVTVGIGANDGGGLLGGLVGICSEDTMPEVVDDVDPCAAWVDGTLSELLESTVLPAVVSALRDARRRAPDAAILLTGYLRLAPESGTCDDLGVAEAQVPAFARAEAAIASALESAAETAGVDYLDLHAASAGHDVCSDEPWVNGLDPGDGDGVLLHPNAAGMAAVADAAAEHLRPTSG